MHSFMPRVQRLNALLSLQPICVSLQSMRIPLQILLTHMQALFNLEKYTLRHQEYHLSVSNPQDHIILELSAIVLTL